MIIGILRESRAFLGISTDNERREAGRGNSTWSTRPLPHIQFEKELNEANDSA